MGNCGVGFAPVQPGQQEFLIGLMEGVEDIPGSALSEGIKWGWESFPEYMNAIEKMPRVLDVGAQMPHGSLRTYVMGERGARNEEATPDDIAKMAALVRDSLRAGALGFTTSRTMLHRAKNKDLVPGTFASEAELLGIGRAMGDVGHGVFEMASDMVGADATMEWMIKLSTETGLPITFAMAQVDSNPDGFRHMLERVRKYNANGAHLVPQIPGRPTGMLMGLQSSLHPFIAHRSYQEIAHLPIDERVAAMRDPQVRARILADEPACEGSGDALSADQLREVLCARRSAQLRARARDQRRRARRARGQDAGGADLRFDARARRTRAALHAVRQLLGLQLRRAARDAARILSPRSG